ncbi:hypothetical protein Ahy_B08g092017 isoform B [Arachis hypogaea]|uniref:Bidirectional sugar transporter SWEET n=1 Tax=Arachis hypogaea TaxID=3818 RepID=A0A444Y328_ARAHY|nr:hypothetical protein Ahy_B08g092017 isoform B [Arachis hypogaea]
MSFSAAYPVYEVAKDAAGVAGNIFAFGLFVSPIPTFRRIIRNGSTEMFSGLPYIYSLMNCLICMWYGTPLISPDNLLVTTVNSIGAVFQFVYIIIFLVYAEKSKKVRMFGLLLAVIGVFVIILVGSLQVTDSQTRRILVGFLSCASLISMFASPLFIIKLVIQTKSVEFMPFYLSLSTFLMSTSFLVYGLLNEDPFIYVPNGIGTVLGIIQLVLYFYFESKSREESGEPLICYNVSLINQPEISFINENMHLETDSKVQRINSCYIPLILSIFLMQLLLHPCEWPEVTLVNHFKVQSSKFLYICAFIGGVEQCFQIGILKGKTYIVHCCYNFSWRLSFDLLLQLGHFHVHQI